VVILVAPSQVTFHFTRRKEDVERCQGILGKFFFIDGMIGKDSFSDNNLCIRNQAEGASHAKHGERS
jgi:hypothetical protein